ncbi:UTP--glucose-1-phosphate uridylyltransferase, partial [Bacillus cereus]|nr:UTP--glucose-1-phosphate uridylyltransferase [Bacillus thuringiensis]MEC3166194.1 UTP--glucose-1-phosphate uridylyltransferase [Bacillus cereus]
FEGKRYDVGEKLGFVQTTIEMALQHPELRDDMVAMMKKILEEQANQES